MLTLVAFTVRVIPLPKELDKQPQDRVWSSVSVHVPRFLLGPLDWVLAQEVSVP